MKISPSLLSSIALVAFLVVTSSTPAVAVSLDESNPAASAQTVTAEAAQPEHLQTFTVQDAALVPVHRDGYKVGAIPKPKPKPKPASLAGGDINQVDDGVQWPVPHDTISTGFGPQVPPCDGCSDFHDGLDINPGIGTPIHAIARGVVVEVSAVDSGGLGVHAIIQHEIDGQSVRSAYGHMLLGSLRVSVGEAVSEGEMIGNVGSTGQSTGPHLHFGIFLDGSSEASDPAAWMAAHGA